MQDAQWQQPRNIVVNVLRSATSPGVAADVAAIFTTWAFVLFGLLALCSLVDRGHRRVAATVLLLTAVAAGVAAAGGLGLKRLVREPRPCQASPAQTVWGACPPRRDFSFPSNHAVIAGAAATGLVVVAWQIHRAWIGVAAVLTALAIAASRVYLGVHYWHDVLIGLLAGAAVTSLLIAAGRLLRPLVGRLHTAGRHGTGRRDDTAQQSDQGTRCTPRGGAGQ